MTWAVAHVRLCCCQPVVLWFRHALHFMKSKAFYFPFVPSVTSMHLVIIYFTVNKQAKSWEKAVKPYSIRKPKIASSVMRIEDLSWLHYPFPYYSNRRKTVTDKQQFWVDLCVSCFSFSPGPLLLSVWLEVWFFLSRIRIHHRGNTNAPPSLFETKRDVTNPKLIHLCHIH